MLSRICVQELQTQWFPHMTDSGLDRIIELLEQASPLMLQGAFSRAVPMGCLATQAGWHHPRTTHLTSSAGITWLHAVVGLNPGLSAVIREWDAGGLQNLELRSEFLKLFREERGRRAETKAARRVFQPERAAVKCGV